MPAICHPEDLQHTSAPTLPTVWVEHRSVITVVYVYFLLVWAALARQGLATGTPPAAQFRMGFVELITVTGFALFLHAVANRSERAWYSSSKIIGALLVGLLAPAVIGIYSAWKQALAVVVHYDWDPVLHRVSLALYGAPEWTYFSALYKYPLLIRAVDWFYFVGWGVATTATIVSIAWSDRRILRLQVLLATVLSWAVLGSLGAGLFASGGPVFYHLFVSGPDPYEPLHAALARTPGLLSLEIQSYLSHAWQMNNWQALTGISAMPSLHVAQGCLTALLLNQSASRLLRTSGWLYLLGLFLGSVILGWHYAVDGLVSITVVAIIWQISRWVAYHELACLGASSRAQERVHFRNPSSVTPS